MATDKQALLARLAEGVPTADPSGIVLNVPGASVSSGNFSDVENNIFSKNGFMYDGFNFCWKIDGDEKTLGVAVNKVAVDFGSDIEAADYVTRKSEFAAAGLEYFVLERPAGGKGDLDFSEMEF